MSSWVDRGKNLPKPGNGGNLTLDRAGALNVVRTENQVRPHDGFKSSALQVNHPVRAKQDGRRTLILAKPPAWTEAAGRPCDTELTGRMARAHMDKWDTWVESEAEALCAGCPVQLACLVAAVAEERGLSAQGRFMVRGGVTPQGRVRLEQMGETA